MAVNGGVPGWSPDLERSFKEVLYRFLEEVQSTKAALYLLAPDGGYVLMAQYGFGRRDLLAAELHARDPLVMRCRELRSRPQAFNRPDDFAEVAQYLEGAGTARLLLVPFSAGSRLLGFVDARDKGRKRPFESVDTVRASAIAATLVDLIRQAGLYPDLDVVPEEVGHREVRVEPPVGDTPPGEPLLDSRGLAQVVEAAESLLASPGVGGVALSLVEPTAASTILLSARGHDPADVEPVRSHHRELLRQELREMVAPAAWEVEQRSVASALQGVRSRLIASTVLLRAPGWALLGSAVGRAGCAATQAALERLQLAADTALEGSRLRFVRRRLARRLLQPRPEELAELVAHSAAVSRLSARLAQDLGLAEVEVEEAALAGLLHDVGMRELDYDRLYRHPAPGPEERRQYQQHVVVGERLVRDGGLSGEVAAAVRHHHERWDGRGYPDQLGGEEIPALARVVHVAEVFDVLTSATSYRRQVGTQRALQVLRQAAGQQFDRELVERLVRVVGA